MLRNFAIAFTALLVPACVSSGSDADIEDGVNDTAGGKSDSIAEGSTAAAAILSLVNDPLITVEQLDHDAGLSPGVAEGIIALRDAQTIDDLAELDAVPNVGSLTFQQLANYAPSVIPEKDFLIATALVHEDTTWSPSMGTIRPLGILRIPAYVTLTITAGTKVEFPSSLHVEGTLVIKGVRSAPVAVSADAESEGSGWGGVIVENHGRAVLDHVALANAQIGITVRSGAEVTARNVTVDEFGFQAVRVAAEASISIDGLIATDSPTGWAIRVDEGGTATIRNAVIARTELALYNEGTVVFDGATLVGSAGNYSGTTGSQTTIRNSIVVGGALGESQGTIALDRVLLWQTTEKDLPTGAQVLRGDPLFVSPNDFRLTNMSPAVDAGSGGTSHDLAGRARVNAPDLGAYELAH